MWFTCVLEKDGNAKEGSVVVGLEGEQPLVVGLGGLVVAPLLVDVGTSQEGIDVARVDVEYLGVAEDGFVEVAE